MTSHTIEAEIGVQFRLNDMPEDEHETAYLKVEITYSFTEGYPETGPTYSSGGEPGAPDEVSLISAKLIDGDGLAPEQDQINDWAQNWLNDEGYDAAVKNAKLEREPDPDYERDKMIEDREMFRHDDGGDDW